MKKDVFADVQLPKLQERGTVYQELGDKAK